LLHGFAGIDSGLMRLICRHHHDGWIELIFSDDGRGITEEHLNHIFDPFFTTQLGKGGSGLGLHIVHNIVTGLLGGSITAHSAKGEGTRFTLFLPLTAPDQADATKDKLAYGIG
jgi:signal transduction histidine kinase